MPKEANVLVLVVAGSAQAVRNSACVAHEMSMNPRCFLRSRAIAFVLRALTLALVRRWQATSTKAQNTKTKMDITHVFDATL